MSYINKTSLLVPSQLPEFVRDNPDYSTFVSFLQAYYEWLESPDAANTLNTSATTTGEGVTYGSKNLPNYYDIDTTLDGFLQYYENDFLSFFPEGSLVDERKLIKVAKELYQSKGTPASYEFLFRVLYNSDVNLFNSSDYILKPSDGKWIVTRSLKLSSIDPNWLKTINYRLFGLTSKGYATIELVTIGENSVEIVLSGIDRNFTSGEFVEVVDIHGAPVLFNGNTLQAQILGVLNSVVVDPNNVGSGYNVGDPVVFYGGLNPNVTNPTPALGYISQVSGASIILVNPVYKGQGYRPGSYTSVNINSGSGTGSGASDIATTFDPTPYYINLVNNDTIGSKANTQIGNGSHLVSYNFANLTSANYNTQLQLALGFPVLNTFGIIGTTVTSGGTGYDATTTANATGYYLTDTNTLEALPNIGILGPIQITTGGINYHVNDKIVFTGGTGYGAFANVTSVASNGAITTVSFVHDPSGATAYPFGGMGYKANSLPVLTVNTATGSGASLYVPGLVGGDATFNINSTSYGQVQQITLTNTGKDYISAPGISLRVEDLLVYNVNVLNEPKQGDIIYQGSITNEFFYANVDSISINTANSSNGYFSTYNLRTYDYNGAFDPAANIYVKRNGVDIGTTIKLSNTTTGIYTSGRKIYGNGSAKAIANFLNGIVLGAGFYQNADGQPSAYSVLEDSTYNNYTYILQVQEALAKYKNTALSFLHPSGMNYNAINLLKSNSSFSSSMSPGEELTVKPLSYLLGTTNYVANSQPNASNTIVIFTNTSGANVANVVQANSYLTIYTVYGEPYYSKVTKVTSNTITLQDDWVFAVPNVAVASASSGSNVINISSLTNAWNIATGNTISYISDFMHIYDSVSFDGVTYKTITHVDQPGSGSRIFVNSAYGSQQTGYLSFKANVISSNVWVSGITSIAETMDITDEQGDPIAAEDGTILLIG